ncbi:glyoxylate/hydroxypyruvate reductase A [Pacificibacter sp. AS14]|uniref:2-hydroxyacid dehydrogenase n=1 Tax=Pacificibacter sp. AS14 TaxID=3135785 RepID=UPI00317E51A0
MAFLFNEQDPDRIAAFEAAFADLPVALKHIDAAYDPNEIRYVFTWQPLEDWSRFPNLEVVFSVSAGVDQLKGLPDHIALIKMVDPHNTQSVVDYVLTACLAITRGFPIYAEQQKRKVWEQHPNVPLAQTQVAILGLGDIGTQTALTLATVGFQVSGWSRNPRDITGVKSVSGNKGYLSLLPDADIVVCLLPLTPETRDLLSASFFAQMKQGAALVQAGRGAHCVSEDLGAALNSGQIGAAVLDVFDTEPLPDASAIWDYPNCLVTPHVAGRTDTKTAVSNVVENLMRHIQGQDLLWQVDRQKGY